MQYENMKRPIRQLAMMLDSVLIDIENNNCTVVNLTDLQYFMDKVQRNISRVAK